MDSADRYRPAHDRRRDRSPTGPGLRRRCLGRRRLGLHVPRRRPCHGSDDRQCSPDGGGRDAACDRGRSPRASCVEAPDGEGSSPDPAPALGPDAGARRRAGNAPGARTGEAALRGQGGDRLRSIVLRVVRRRGEAARRPRHPTIAPGPADRGAERGDRSHRRNHPVELPGRDADAQVGPGSRRRLHDGAETGRADAAHGSCDSGTRRGSGRPRRRVLDRHR